MKDLYVSWDEYHRLIERLALAIHESGWHFDALLCLARGGLRVGDIISRVYDMPLAILAASSYREAAGREQGSLDIGEYITMTRGTLGGNLLLVDDLVDSGVTLARVIDHLKQRFPAVAEVRTAVLWYKACSAFRPDYYVEHLASNPWIHQPFEVYDAMGPQKLAARVRSSAAAANGPSGAASKHE
jgi:hypoxanthine phosphoribosyltransferase